MAANRRSPLLAVLLLAVPAARAARLPRAAPEAEGVSPAAVLSFVDALERKVDAVHGFVLVRHGSIVAEGWWSPYAADLPHQLYSISKSFTAVAVGDAVAEGRLRLDDRVAGFFPDLLPPHPSPNLEAMTVRDLLVMGTGQNLSDLRDFNFNADGDLVRNFLALPVPYAPGSRFAYGTAVSYVLSAILQRRTGQTLFDYLQPRLFRPLGMADATWEASRQGITLGGRGLSARTEDVAAFGQLCLQRGRWEGRQLVPASWVDAAVSRQISNGHDPRNDWSQAYGYQFWLCRHGCYRADGSFGQFCIVMPPYDAVLAITSGTRGTAAIFNAVWDRLLPGLKPAPLPADPGLDRKLSDRLAGLELRPQRGAPAGGPGEKFLGRRYAFRRNPARLETISLEARPDGGTAIVLRQGGSEQSFACGLGRWTEGSLAFDRSPEPIAASGAWTAPNVYVARLYRRLTPFCVTFRLRFVGGLLYLRREYNLGYANGRPIELLGTQE